MITPSSLPPPFPAYPSTASNMSPTAPNPYNPFMPPSAVPVPNTFQQPPWTAPNNQSHPGQEIKMPTQQTPNPQQNSFGQNQFASTHLQNAQVTSSFSPWTPTAGYGMQPSQTVNPQQPNLASGMTSTASSLPSTVPLTHSSYTPEQMQEYQKQWDEYKVKYEKYQRELAEYNQKMQSMYSQSASATAVTPATSAAPNQTGGAAAAAQSQPIVPSAMPNSFPPQMLPYMYGPPMMPAPQQAPQLPAANPFPTGYYPPATSAPTSTAGQFAAPPISFPPWLAANPATSTSSA